MYRTKPICIHILDVFLAALHRIGYRIGTDVSFFKCSSSIVLRSDFFYFISHFAVFIATSTNLYFLSVRFSMTIHMKRFSWIESAIAQKQQYVPLAYIQIVCKHMSPFTHSSSSLSCLLSHSHAFFRMLFFSLFFLTNIVHLLSTLPRTLPLPRIIPLNPGLSFHPQHPTFLILFILLSFSLPGVISIIYPPNTNIDFTWLSYSILI